jgi:hypothetical protein
MARQTSPGEAILGLLVIGGLFLYFHGDLDGLFEKSRAPLPAEPVAADVTQVPNVPPAPQAEKDLAAIVERYARSYEAAPNDMAKGALRPRRAADICGLRLSNVTGWIGRITTLSSNNDGNGVLELRLSDKVSIGTWNNSLSDFEDHTLIPAGSPLHQEAVVLQKGQLSLFRLFHP